MDPILSLKIHWKKLNPVRKFYSSTVSHFILFSLKRIYNQFQERFITSYLSEFASSMDDYRPTTADIEELKEEIRCFTLVSHFLWSLWSIVNVHQEIEFGYWVRMKQRFGTKKSFKRNLTCRRMEYVESRSISLQKSCTSKPKDLN